MAQIIQYKDREKDTSVYPVTVGAAVYMDFNDTNVYQTLDDVMLVKPDSIILFDASYDGSINYTYVSTDDGVILPENLKENVWENIGIKELLHNLEVMVSNITSNYQNKQDRIVSTQHIKTINGVNIVGPGDVSIYEVDKLLGIDSSFDVSSNNAIMNSTATKRFNELENYTTTQDSSITDAITWENISKENE